MSHFAFVTGYKGLIGSNLVKQGAQENHDNLYPAVINCVGFTNVDACETKIKESLDANVTYPIWFVGRMNDDKHFTHLSTDFIFDGRRGYYAEDDVPAPLSIYGAQKWIAERGVVEKHPNTLIVRTTCVFGWHPKKYTFAHWVKDMCARGEPFGVTSEQVTTPTYAPDLARIILELVERRVTGVVNVTSDKLMSRYSFARDLAEAFGYDRNMILKVGNIMQVARRPALGGLCCLKLEGMGITPQSLELSLKEMAATWGQ